MKHYDLELSIVLDDHGYQQALALQAKTGRTKSKIVKFYAGGMTLINSDGSVPKEDFTANKTLRINFIGHGDSGSTVVSDTAGARKWDPATLAKDVRDVVEFALPAARANNKIQRLSMIVCYSGGHTYTTMNSYGAHVEPKDSFGYKFFEKANFWLVDMTARGDVSVTRKFQKANSPPGSLDYNDYTGGMKLVGEGDKKQHHDKYRKVRFYMQGSAVQVEWPYEGYD